MSCDICTVTVACRWWCEHCDKHHPVANMVQWCKEKFEKEEEATRPDLRSSA